MQRWKLILFTTLQICLWMTFILGIFDIGITGSRDALSPFTPVAWLLTPLYNITGALIQPVIWIAWFIGWYQSDSPNPYFPIVNGQSFHDILSSFNLAQYFPLVPYNGVIVWWIPLASILYSLFPPVIDYFSEQTRNWIWNLIIEYGFQRKKARIYAEALSKKNEDLSLLNNQFRALEEEATSLKGSVITDELTMVYNKRFFLNRLQQEFDSAKHRQQPLSLIMIDIDFFKKLNDTYGHLAGDKVLIAVATVLKNCTPQNAFPCRYGGEEFSVIMPGVSMQDAQALANQIQNTILNLKFEALDKKLKVSVSQGICYANFSHGEAQKLLTFDELLEQADKQLYRSKMDGRNRVSSISLG